MSLIGISLLVLIMITVFSMILGNTLVASLSNIAIDNEALVDGNSSTYVISGQDVLFSIDVSNLIDAGIAILITVSIIVLIFGFSVLSSGLNPQASKIAILIATYIGVWSAFSILAFNLILDIQVFGTVIYISLTTVYTIGVVKKLSE